MECDHHKKHFRPNQEGYDIICLSCNKVLKKNRGSFDFDNLVNLFYTLAVAEVCLDIFLKTLKEMESKK